MYFFPPRTASLYSLTKYPIHKQISNAQQSMNNNQIATCKSIEAWKIKIHKILYNIVNIYLSLSTYQHNPPGCFQDLFVLAFQNLILAVGWLQFSPSSMIQCARSYTYIREIERENNYNLHQFVFWTTKSSQH